MLKTDLILRNPLRLLGDETEEIPAPGEMAAVASRAGVGKTALLVQIALNSLLRDKNVLHISLEDPVRKVVLWYDEVLKRIETAGGGIEEIERFRETVFSRRFIMTFRVEGFSVPRLTERLTDLTTQNIFTPNIVLVDGLPFGESARALLTAFQAAATAGGYAVWFAVLTHRHEPVDQNGLPRALQGVSDLFRTILKLEPAGESVFVRAFGKSRETSLLLDPNTLLIRTDTLDPGETASGG